MFKVLQGETKRRAISPLFVAASVAAHALIFGGAVFAAGGEDAEPTPVQLDTTIIWERDEAPPPPPPPLPVMEQPAVEQPRDDVEPVTGENVVLQPPTEVPQTIAPPRADETPITPDMVTGIGGDADVIGPKTDNPGPLTGNNTPPATEPADPDFVIPVEMAEVRPALERNGLARVLERNYPPLLRDSRVSGRVLMEVVVDEDGRVRPNSARIVETSHEQFGEASLRAVERFRFRPARVAGKPVAVRVTIPIVWTLAN